MLKQLRTKTKLIMIIVTLTFIGMIVFQWGMDIGDRYSSSVKSGIIGEVNGVKIKYDQYDTLVRQQRDSVDQSQRLTLDQSRTIYDDVWEYMVTNILVEQEIKKRGITFTDKELFDYMLKNPAQMTYQVPLFQTDNKFDLEKYQVFIKNPENLKNQQTRQFLNYIEYEARRTLPIMKLSQSLENGIIVKETEVREQWLRENEQRKIAWFYINSINLRSYPDSVDTDDVRAYFEENKDKYKIEEMRGLEAVYISLEPSPADSLEVFEQAKFVYERAGGGDDFAELANTYSEDPGNEIQGTKRGGDLGFFGKGTMTQEFEKVAFSLKPGEISEPFLTRYGYHIVKVDSITYKEPEVKADKALKGKNRKPAQPEAVKEINQIKARHILLKIEPSGQTQEAVEQKITAFYEAVRGGMDFYLRSQADSIQVMRLPLITKNAAFIPNVGRNVQILINRVFKSKKGDVLPVYQTDSGFYAFRVSEVKEAGIPTFEESEPRVVEEYKKKLRLDYIQQFCANVNDNVKNGMDLGNAVKALTDTLVSVPVDTTIVTRTYYVPGLGELNPFVAKVFTLANAGDTTGPAVTENGGGLAILIEKLSLDESRYESEKAEVKTKLGNELRNEVLTRYMEELRKNAKIVDNRDIYLSM